MRIVTVLAALAFAGCQPQAPDQTAAPAQPASVETPVEPAAPVKRAEVEGWQTDPSSYAMLGGTAPNFSLDRVGGGKVTQEDLRNRWTILGFWNATIAGIEEEKTYIQALNSAADQDPDLDFLTVYLPLDAAPTDVAKWFANNGGAWPTLTGTDDTASLFAIQKTPAYLLIGPDLTIEAYRGALTTTPDDGIKSVIRGVAEIRKQIVSPG